MPFCFFFLLGLLSAVSFSSSQPPPIRGHFIDCGAAVATESDGFKWLPDDGFVFSGIPKNLTVPVHDPVLSSVRSFPNIRNRKYCYVVPVYRGFRYMIRTMYFYYGINGQGPPPVFDQIVDGTFWSVVNTTEDYANGRPSYYESVFLAKGKAINVCVGSNTYTDSDPFISALEIVLLGNSLYNATDFGTYGLSLVARHSFGHIGPAIRYPDDQYDRFWEPYGLNGPGTEMNRTVPVSGFWNLPPAKIFETKLSIGFLEPLEFSWPPYILPENLNSTYYIALYFANDRDTSVNSSRAFSIFLNGITYYDNLNLTPAGVAVFTTKWPLGGPTNITLSPAAGSVLAPLINAGEVFKVLTLGRRTLVRDAVALGRLKDSMKNPPIDWNGDPCLPPQYSWTGISCSEGPRVRVITLNLTGMGISGSLSRSIANLTALTGIWLGNNNFSGPIPNLSSLKGLETLHLEDNYFSGEIPSSLGDLHKLNELFLENNNLTGKIPSNLLGKPGLTLRTSPGNHFSAPPPPA